MLPNDNLDLKTSDKLSPISDGVTDSSNLVLSYKVEMSYPLYPMPACSKPPTDAKSISTGSPLELVV